ncbi:MAG TPA: phosphonate ABC transporter, permease protein PhnE [Chthoniobacterales bacterium]|jgi:phosphonate transport system permease protein|nr:phosphonate ABC transporter, permease protein PhnE [Chthoniobacterales bacterium]
MQPPLIEAEPPRSRVAVPPVDLKWHERLGVLNISLLLFIVAVICSAGVLRGSGRDLNYLANIRGFFANFFPPDFTVTGQTLIGLCETFQIAVMATAFAIIASVPIAIAGAQTLSPRWLVLISRFLMNAIRTVPSLIWALLAVAIVGPNPLAGVIGLTFYSVGYLGKFFSDAFESVDIEVARALRAAGARTIQAFQYGLWPHAKPLVWSYSLWMLEYNIRSAAIVGIVGAGGVGLQLHTYQEYYQWNKFATVLLFMFLLVSALDLLGERVRNQIVRKAVSTKTL